MKTRKIFMRIPPNATPEQKKRLVEEMARRLEAEWKRVKRLN